MVKNIRTINPLVSTEWLGDSNVDPPIVTIDIRNNEEYRRGHIPGAVNAPFTRWMTTRNDLFLELPDDADLFNTIGVTGIKTGSTVIVVNKTDNPYPLADACRVACTLLYAGVDNVSILDGGHNKWVKEGRLLSNKEVQPDTMEYEGKINNAMFVSQDYVQKKIGKSIILDTRDPNVYFGVTIEPTAQRAGHIPGARCLPAPWLWTADGTYRSIDELGKMASGVVGKDVYKEIIVYCGVGGYAAAWWFVLTQLLGYKNVKFYDGSAQEWTRDPQITVVMYKWE